MKTGLQSAYGLEYSGGLITVVQAVRRKGRIESDVLACGKTWSDFTSWPELADQIRRDQASGRAMVSALAFSHDSFIRPLQAPFPSIKKAQAVLPSLLDVQLPFPLEQCTYRFANVHKPENGNVRALAVAIPHDRLQLQLENVRAIGIDPEWIEQESLALWRCALRQFPAGSASNRVVIYLGADRTVAVSGKNLMPVASLGTRVPWSASMDDASGAKLANRLRQHLAGAFHGESGMPVEFLIGGPAAATSARLREQMEIPAENWKIMAKPESCLAAALAEGMLEPDVWSENLRTGTLTHAHIIRHGRRVENRALTILALAALMLTTASLGALQLVKKAHDTLQAQIRNDAALITGMNYIPRGQELFVAKQYVEESSERFKEFRQWMEPDAYPLFDQVVRSAHQIDMTLEALSVRSGALLARGTCVDWNDPDKVTQPLAANGWKVETERKDAGHDERVHFTVRAQP